jgi:RNA recognition motif-containing protein
MGRKDKGDNEVNFTDSILSIMRGSSEKSMNIKELRKLVLLSHQIDTDDKDSKKKFKKTILVLENDKRLALSEDGIVKLQKSALKEESKKKKKKSKRSSEEDEQQDTGKKQRVSKDTDATNSDHNENGEDDVAEGNPTHNEREKKAPCKGNPLGITRLFLGNLPFTVDEAYLKEFIAPAQLTHIKWITDKETGKFYGSAFVEMRNTKDAAIAVTEKNGLELIGRPIRINYAPAREGDLWPPKSTVENGGGGGDATTGRTAQAGGVGLKSMSAKPENCFKLFIGNLSYSIDDDAITKFFASVDAEVKTVRWLHHKDSGDFKGGEYAEYL